VERAQPLPRAALLFQPDMLARNIDEVGGLADAGDDIAVEVSVDHSSSFSHSGSEGNVETFER